MTQTNFTTNPGGALPGLIKGRAHTSRRLLPQRAQVTTLAIASSEAGDYVITVTDRQTSQAYTLTVTLSGAVEATSLDEILADWQANGKLNSLASVTENGTTDFVITFRHANRAYTVAVDPPGSMTTTVTETTPAGGAGVAPGLWVARGANDYEIDVPGATTTVGQLVGILPRLTGELERDYDAAFDAEDLLKRGRDYPVLMSGSEVWVQVEEAVTPGSTPYVRRALTSNAGTVGAMRDTPAGGQAVYTATPTAINLTGYGFEFGWRGRHYTALYVGDGGTTVAVACDGLVANLGTISGLTIADSATTVTITTAAGEDLDYIRQMANHTDVPADSVTVANGTPADIDAIDVSSLCYFVTSAAANGLALVRIK